MRWGIGGLGFVAGIVVIIGLLVFTFLIYRPAATGQAVAQQPSQVPLQQQLINPVQQPDAQGGAVQTAKTCEERSNEMPSQSRDEYLQACKKNLNKVCFDNSACGPLKCINYKCQ